MTTVLFLFFFFPCNQIQNVHLPRSVWPKSWDLHSCFSSHLTRAIDKIPIWGLYVILAGLASFFWPRRVITYSPHTGIFSIVLQWKRAQGRMGHMIRSNYSFVRRLKNQCCPRFSHKHIDLWPQRNFKDLWKIFEDLQRILEDPWDIFEDL